MVSDRALQSTLAATQSRRILARLQEGVWHLLHLLDLPPLETDPLIQLLIDHLGEDLARDQLRPRRNLDINILELKLQQRPTS